MLKNFQVSQSTTNISNVKNNFQVSQSTTHISNVKNNFQVSQSTTNINNVKKNSKSYKPNIFLKEIESNVVGRINLPHNRGQWYSLVNTAINFPVTQ